MDPSPLHHRCKTTSSKVILHKRIKQEKCDLTRSRCRRDDEAHDSSCWIHRGARRFCGQGARKEREVCNQRPDPQSRWRKSENDGGEIDLDLSLFKPICFRVYPFENKCVLLHVGKPCPVLRFWKATRFLREFLAYRPPSQVEHVRSLVAQTWFLFSKTKLRTKRETLGKWNTDLFSYVLSGGNQVPISG